MEILKPCRRAAESGLDPVRCTRSEEYLVSLAQTKGRGALDGSRRCALPENQSVVFVTIDGIRPAAYFRVSRQRRFDPVAIRKWAGTTTCP